MITDVNEFVLNYNVEERTNDTIVNELKENEDFFSRNYPVTYEKIVNDEEGYATSKELLKDIVYNLSLGNLMMRQSVSTRYGTVQKNEEYSDHQNFDTMIKESIIYVEKALRKYKEFTIVTIFDDTEKPIDHLKELRNLQYSIEYYFEK